MEKQCMIKKLLYITIGALIISFGIYNFYYQNGITEGGLLGIFLILKNLFGFDLSMSNLFIDGALIVFGLRYFGKRFFGYTIFATSAFSVAYAVFEKIGFVFTVNNNFIAAVIGGLCVGVGCGIIINSDAASGGDDVLALIFSKITNIELGNIYLIFDISILLLSLVYMPINKIFYSVIAVVISGKVINVMYRNNKQVTLVEKEDSVAEERLVA